MQDKHNREIDYLRVSVTDRCNLRCIYCMPLQGVKNIYHSDILSLEEIARIVEAATLVGIKKIRLTGGEPLVRKGIHALINMISAIRGIDDIGITTNGILLASQIQELKKAGLKRVNISLDSLRPERYEYITRGGNFRRVWKGIEKSLELNLHPVKLNTVVIKGFNDDEILDLARISIDYPIHVRFIEVMPIGTSKSWAENCFVSAVQIKKVIEQRFGNLVDVRKLNGSGPARSCRLTKAAGTVGFVTAISDHFCNRCNRLRLTSKGGLRACLFDEHEIDVKGPLREGASLEELAELVAKTIRIKPGRHHMYEDGTGVERLMSQIGG